MLLLYELTFIIFQHYNSTVSYLYYDNYDREVNVLIKMLMMYQSNLQNHVVLWIDKSSTLNLLYFAEVNSSALFNSQSNKIVSHKQQLFLCNDANPFLFMIPVVNSIKNNNKNLPSAIFKP